MNTEQATALIVAITALVAAVGTTYAQIRSLRRDVRVSHELMNGRLQDLLDVSAIAAKKQGELEGRAFRAHQSNP